MANSLPMLADECLSIRLHRSVDRDRRKWKAMNTERGRTDSRDWTSVQVRVIIKSGL